MYVRGSCSLLFTRDRHSEIHFFLNSAKRAVVTPSLINQTSCYRHDVHLYSGRLTEKYRNIHTLKRKRERETIYLLYFWF